MDFVSPAQMPQALPPGVGDHPTYSGGSSAVEGAGRQCGNPAGAPVKDRQNACPTSDSIATTDRRQGTTITGTVELRRILAALEPREDLGQLVVEDEPTTRTSARPHSTASIAPPHERPSATKFSTSTSPWSRRWRGVVEPGPCLPLPLVEDVGLVGAHRRDDHPPRTNGEGHQPQPCPIIADPRDRSRGVQPRRRPGSLVTRVIRPPPAGRYPRGSDGDGNGGGVQHTVRLRCDRDIQPAGRSHRTRQR